MDCIGLRWEGVLRSGECWVNCKNGDHICSIGFPSGRVFHKTGEKSVASQPYLCGINTVYIPLIVAIREINRLCLFCREFALFMSGLVWCCATWHGRGGFHSRVQHEHRKLRNDTAFVFI